MNILKLTKRFLNLSLQSSRTTSLLSCKSWYSSNLVTKSSIPAIPHHSFNSNSFLKPTPQFSLLNRHVSMDTLARKGPHTKKRKPKRHMEGRPFMKAIVLKTVIRKPKKPNSANRKCVRVRLSNGREITAYIPGEGHNLQEHNVVLIRGGRCQDLIGVKHKVVRGKHDCAHVVKKKS